MILPLRCLFQAAVSCVFLAQATAGETVPIDSGKWFSEVVCELSGKWEDPLETYSVFADRDGVIWCGTSDGIYALEGGTPSETGLFADHSGVISMAQLAERNEIWVLTSKGIGFFTSGSEEAVFFESPDAVDLRDFVFDADGRLWVTSEAGLISFSPESRSWGNMVAATALAAPGQLIRDQADPEVLWVCDSVSGLIRYSIEDEALEVIASAKSEDTTDSPLELVSVCQTPDGRIWAGGRNGILELDPQSNSFEFLRFEDREKFPNRVLTTVHPNVEGTRLWIGTEAGRGLLQFDCESRRVRDYGDSIRVQEIRGAISLQDIIVDDFGVLWMAAKNGGLLRTNSTTDGIQQFSSLAGRSDAIPPGLVMRSFEVDNRLVVHSVGGVAQVFPKERKVRRIRFPQASGMNILAMGRLDSLTFVLITENELIKVRQRHAGPWDFLEAIPFDSTRKVNSVSCSESTDANGMLWFGVNTDLFRFDSRTSSIEKMEQFSTRVGEIYTFKNEVWVSNDGQLHRYENKTKTWSVVDLGKDVRIKHVILSEDGVKVWVATSNGLFVCNRKTLKPVRIPAVNTTLHSLCTGPEGKLWVVANGYLKLFDIKTRQFQPYAGRPELNSRVSNLRSIVRSENGDLRLGGHGVFVTVPEEILYSGSIPRVPALRLSRLELLGEEGNRESPLYGNQIPDLIELEPSDHGVRLHAMIPDYRHPVANLYEYRIDGSEWKRYRNGTLEIASISKGGHTLELRAMSSTGVSAGPPIVTQLKAMPHLWKTAPFYAVIFFVSILLIALHFRWRTSLLNRSKLELETVNEALSESDERFRRIFASSTDAIIVTDKDFRIIACNPASKQMVGAEVDEDFAEIGVTANTISDFVSMAFDSGIHSGEILMEAVDGSVIRTEASLVNAEGHLARWQFQLRDITQQTEWEEQIRQAQKMDAVGTLAGGIAHDFNNLLSPIAVHSQLSREALEQKQDAAVPGAIDAFMICSEAAAKAAELVQSLLRFAKTTDEGARVEDLVPVIETSGRLLRGSLSSNVTLDIEIEDQPANVFCSAQQFEQCLMNLVVNAGHAIGIENGKVKVSLSKLNDASVLLPEQAAQSDGIWSLEVSDNGKGMDEATRAKVFDPFFTTKALGEGSGLGLSMVHSFVGEFGCGIEVESEMGKGTTFRLLFPDVAVDLEAIAESDRDELSEASDLAVLPRRLLVVDDDPAVLLATTLILRKLGHEVISKNDPLEALAMFESDQRFDAVVTDQMMPGITGIRLAQRIHEISSTIPVILLTGFSQEMLEKGDHGADISMVHMKPLDYSELNGSLHRFSQPEALASNQEIALSS